VVEDKSVTVLLSPVIGGNFLGHVGEFYCFWPAFLRR
jgi:hypothetical protein